MINANEIFEIKELESDVDNGYVSKRKHPDFPLFIYNYTNKAVIDNHWNEVTRTCRGLILDDKYNVVARPFRKFFNLNTASEPETLLENLPKTKPIIMEKMDGSLGILWRWDGNEGIATRGSFTSEQAIWATEHWKAIKLTRWYFNFVKDITPLFEIIFPDNRIVVNYGDRKDLVLLGIVNNNNGSEVPYQELKNTGYNSIVRSYSNISVDNCISSMSSKDSIGEGYVLLYEMPQSAYPLRIKMKFDEYARLHRLIFNLSDKVIWELLSNETNPLDNIHDLPYDVYRWISEQTNKFLWSYIKKQNRALKIVGSHDNTQYSRKDIANFYKQFPDVMQICFGLLDRKDVKSMIWKSIKPEKINTFRRENHDAE